MSEITAPRKVIRFTKHWRDADGVIHYSYWDNDKKQTVRRSTGETDSAAATAWIRREEKILNGEIAELKTKTADQQTLDDLFERYDKYHASVENADGGYNQRWFYNKAIKPVFGHRIADSIKFREVEDFKAELTRNGWTSGSVRRAQGVLKRVYNYNIKIEEYDGRTPLVKLAKKNPARDTTLDADEETELYALALKYSDGGPVKRITLFVCIAMDCAARKTAIIQLRWSRIHWKRKGPNGEVQPMMDFGEREHAESNKRRPLIPVPERLLPLLRRAYAERKPGCDFVFGTPSWDHRRDFAAFIKTTPHKDREAGDRITAHVFRHTWATLMIEDGATDVDVAAVMADTPQTVARTYNHRRPSTLGRVVNRRFALKEAAE